MDMQDPRRDGVRNVSNKIASSSENGVMGKDWGDGVMGCWGRMGKNGMMASRTDEMKRSQSIRPSTPSPHHPSAPTAKRSGARLIVGVTLAACFMFGLRFRETRFTGDDAYISYRYARNIARGEGPVFNTGERVEGYTNHLWVLVLSAGEVMGIESETTAQILGLVCGLGIVIVGTRLAFCLSGGSMWVILVPLCLAFSRDVVGWSSSGLEMGFFSFLILAAALATVHEGRSGWRPYSIWLSSLAALTRPEGFLWLIGLVLFSRGREKVWRAGLSLVLVLPALIFRVSYYGELLPNTAFAKGSMCPERGLFYAGEFLRVHPGFPLWAPLATMALKQVRYLGGILLVYLSYVLAVGGDFMEFRMMVPMIVVSLSLAPMVLQRLRLPTALLLALGCLIGAGWSTVHGYRQHPSPYMIENIESLSANAQSWAKIGAFLGTMARRDELIAVGPAGAIPYFSDLPTVDMLGLCDWWVARFGRRASQAAGHQRVAPWEYLARRGVVWLVAQPQLSAQSHRGAEKISVRTPWGRYLIMGTTLNPDSLRHVLAQRGFEVAFPELDACRQEERRAPERLIQAWRFFGEGEFSRAREGARGARGSAHALGARWRWLVREALDLEESCAEAMGEEDAERKRWEEIEEEVPERWRSRLELVKSPGCRLDTVDASR